MTNLKGFNKRKKADFLFFLSIVILPSIQFCICYIGVNFNSFIQAFKQYEYNIGGTGYIQSFAGFSNFKTAFEAFKNNSYMIKNSFILFGFNILLGMPLALIFSFYIYKKYPLSGLYRVVLFMPQIISGLVFALLFNYITTNVYQTLVEKFTGNRVQGLLYGLDTRFATVIFFNLWASFGVNVLLFSGNMSNINESVVESAQLDGVNVVQEFIYISLPLIYPTIVQLLVIAITGLCTNQMGLMNLYGMNTSECTEMSTIGMFLYSNATGVQLIRTRDAYSFGQLSAMGLVLTVIMLPITLLARNLLNKFGPSVD